MRLGEYAATFPSYPWLEPVKPFAGWGATGNPTQELAWYDAYNAVKHDRETEFGRATLEHVFAAVAACAIMMAAQFGLSDGLGTHSEVRAFIDIQSPPAWPFSEVYIFPYGEGRPEWHAVPYPF